MRRGWVLPAVTALALVAALFTLPAARAAADPAPPPLRCLQKAVFGDCVTPPPEGLPPIFREHERRYVALGDSFSSGEGAPHNRVVDTGRSALGKLEVREFLPGTAEPGDSCHRSLEAYPAKVAHELGDGWSLGFRACSGAKVGNYDSSISAPAGGNKEQNQRSGMERGADLVTYTFGGNDVDFADLGKDCLRHSLFVTPTKYESPCRDGDDAQAQRQLAQLPAKVRALNTSIGALLNPHGRVIVLGYPEVFPQNPGGSCQDGLAGHISRPDMIWFNSVADRLNDVLQREARLAGFSYLDVSDLFRTGGVRHDACINDGAQRWINRTILSNQVWSFHPKAAAHDEEARRIVACYQDPARCAAAPTNSVFDLPDTPPAGAGGSECPAPPPGLPEDIRCLYLVSADIDGNGTPDRVLSWTNNPRVSYPVRALVGVTVRLDDGTTHGLDTVLSKATSRGSPLEPETMFPAHVVRLDGGPREQVLMTVAVGANTDEDVVVLDDRGGGVDLARAIDGSVFTVYDGGAALHADRFGCVTVQGAPRLVTASWEELSSYDGSRTSQLTWQATYYELAMSKFVPRRQRSGVLDAGTGQTMSAAGVGELAAVGADSCVRPTTPRRHPRRPHRTTLDATNTSMIN